MNRSATLKVRVRAVRKESGPISHFKDAKA